MCIDRGGPSWWARYAPAYLKSGPPRPARPPGIGLRTTDSLSCSHRRLLASSVITRARYLHPDSLSSSSRLAQTPSQDCVQRRRSLLATGLRPPDPLTDRHQAPPAGCCSVAGAGPPLDGQTPVEACLPLARPQPGLPPAPTGQIKSKSPIPHSPP